MADVVLRVLVTDDMRIFISLSDITPYQIPSSAIVLVAASSMSAPTSSFMMPLVRTSSMLSLYLAVNGFPVTKSKDWTKYEATLKADYNDPQAQFALVFDGTGQVQLDVISLFPPTFKNRENGMRPDLANMLWQLHPKFMRFPGGCFVEGQESPDNARSMMYR